MKDETMINLEGKEDTFGYLTTSDEAFDCMNKGMPGQEAIRFGHNQEHSEARETILKGVDTLREIWESIALLKMSYYASEMIKVRIDGLTNDLLKVAEYDC